MRIIPIRFWFYRFKDWIVLRNPFAKKYQGSLILIFRIINFFNTYALENIKKDILYFDSLDEQEKSNLKKAVQSWPISINKYFYMESKKLLILKLLAYILETNLNKNSNIEKFYSYCYGF